MQNQDVFVKLTNYFFVSHLLKKGKISIPHIRQLWHITSKWITDYPKIYIYIIFDECIEYFQRLNIRSNRIVNPYHRTKNTCLIYHIKYKLHYPKSLICSSLFLLFASQKVSSLFSLLVFPSLLLSVKHAHCIHLVCMGNTY